jgi:dTDP-glucose 4,6-dehydratase
MSRKKVLVTGSGGFIGSNFIRQTFYAKIPYAISSLDRVRESHIIHNIYVNSDHVFYIADIRDPHIIQVIFQKERPDIVVHFAAESCVDKSINSTLPFITSNVVGTQNIIDECLRIDSKLLYMSADEVYGALTDDRAEPWTETSPMNPRNTYSASKAAGELLVRAAHETHGLRYNIVRACNNYGPWQTNEKFIPRIIHCILNDKEIPIYGKGDQIRDWIHVSDTCDALYHVIDKGKDSEIYNITAKQEFMNLEVAQIICNTMEKGHNLLKHVEDRLGHDFRYAMSNDKIKELGWVPKLKFRDGVRQTCQWYVSNQYALKL